jgi:hypothetical protein
MAEGTADAVRFSSDVLVMEESEDIRDRKLALKRAEVAVADAQDFLKNATTNLTTWKEGKQDYKGDDPDFLVRASEVDKARESLKEARESLEKARESLKEAHERLKEEREYHLMLMEAADRKRRKLAMEGSWEWKDEVEPVYSLENRLTYFVNRDRAVQQLQEIHQDKFTRAVFNAGDNWTIPMADNIIGMGKTSFGDHYIRKCREVWKDVVNPSQFQTTLCACRTVHLIFNRGDLLKPSFDNVMINSQLVPRLRGMFTKPPAIISDPPVETHVFLNQLTDKVGPLFIVLDEIGAAFEADDLSDVDSREQFMKFCLNIIGKWAQIRNIFFLFLGRGSFLSYVGMRPTREDLLRSCFKCSRLSIHLLRPDAIKTIIEKTFVDTVEKRTIKEVCELDDDQLNDVAQHLFQQTCGHPRTLLGALKKCRSFSQLMEFSQPIDIDNWALFYGELRKYSTHVSKLLESMGRGGYVDLTEQVEDVGKRLISKDIIANNCCIAWEGTADQAKLYAAPFILQLMLQYLLPFQEYIRAMASVNFSIDYPTVFEWVCLKRFQEMFRTAQCPMDVLPEFFNQSQRFGRCRDVSFANDTRQLPKITTNGNKYPKLDSQTADPTAWPQLLQNIEAKMAQELLTSVCLKPLPKSSSSDALLMTQIGDVLLTLGLAVKNFTSTKFSPADLTNECNLFNRMFVGCPNVPKRLNVLVVCATKYNKSVSEKFHMRKSVSVQAEGCQYIDEVILLDLSTPSNRAHFFGISNDRALSEVLEAVISKVEVEFEKSKQQQLVC